jgi:hypothetical protein
MVCDFPGLYNASLDISTPSGHFDDRLEARAPVRQESFDGQPPAREAQNIAAEFDPVT